MPNNRVFAGRGLDGLISAAIIAREIDPSVHFITQGTEKGSLRVGGPGVTYFVDLHTKRLEVLGILPNSDYLWERQQTYYFDQRLYSKTDQDSSPFFHVSIDDKTSNSERVFLHLHSDLDIMLPAMVSLSYGFQDSELVGEALEAYGEKVESNLRLLELSLAEMYWSNSFRTDLMNLLRCNRLPEDDMNVADAARLGEVRFGRVLRKISRESMEYLEVTKVPPLFPSYGRLLARHLVKTGDKSVGVVLEETAKDKERYKIAVFSSDPRIHIGGLLRESTVHSMTFGGLRTTGGGRYLKERTPQFLSRLDRLLVQAYSESEVERQADASR